jgi:hypothetical protein
MPEDTIPTDGEPTTAAHDDEGAGATAAETGTGTPLLRPREDPVDDDDVDDDDDDDVDDDDDDDDDDEQQADNISTSTALTQSTKQVKACAQTNLDYQNIAGAAAIASGVFTILALGAMFVFPPAGVALTIGAVELTGGQLVALAAGTDAGIFSVINGAATMGAASTQTCANDPPRPDFDEVIVFTPIQHRPVGLPPAPIPPKPPAPPNPPPAPPVLPASVAAAATVFANSSLALDAFTTTLERLDGAKTAYLRTRSEANATAVVAQAKALATNGQACASQMTATQTSANVLAQNWGTVTSSAGSTPPPAAHLAWSLIAVWQANREHFASTYGLSAAQLASLDGQVVVQAQSIQSGATTLASAHASIEVAAAGVGTTASNSAFSSLASAYAAATS